MGYSIFNQKIRMLLNSNQKNNALISFEAGKDDVSSPAGLQAMRQVRQNPDMSRAQLASILRGVEKTRRERVREGGSWAVLLRQSREASANNNVKVVA